MSRLQMAALRIARCWLAAWACLAGFANCVPASAAIPAAPEQTYFANLWYPRDATHLRYTTFTGAALYYNIVDWQPGYVERSNCRLVSGGVAMTAPQVEQIFGPSYIYMVYTSQCTDIWGGPRYGTVINLLPKLHCPANSTLEGSACSCNPGFVEEGAVCTAFSGRPVEEDGAMCQAGAQVGHPIVPATGEKVLAQTDYAGFGPHALGFVRHYRSAWVNRPGGAGFGGGALGAAWSHNHAVQLTLVSVSASSAQVRFGDGEALLFKRAPGQTAWTGIDTIDQLEQIAGTTVLTRQTDGSKLAFDGAGRLTHVTQRNQWQTSYRYSDATTPPDTAAQPGLLIQVSNQFGASLQFQYTATGQLKAMLTPGGETVLYGYDASQRLSTITYPGNEVQTLVYEDSRWPLAVTGLVDERGVRLATYGYDGIGRAVQTEHALGADRYSVVYGASAGDPVTVTDPLGTQRRYTYATSGNRLVVTSADAPAGTPGADAARRGHDAKGLVESETDYLGVTTTRTWDAQRRLPLSTTRAADTVLAQTTATQWHAVWRLPVTVTQAGRTVSFDYDSNANLLSRTVTDLATGQTRVERWTYNNVGLVATATDPLGAVTTLGYDERGNRESSTDALGRVTRFAHDAQSRLVRQSDPGGLVTGWAYDARGRLTVHTAGGEQTRFDYLPSGQISRVAMPDGYVTYLTYDAAQRLARVANNRGQVIDYVLDAMGNRVWESAADASGGAPQTLRRMVDRLNRIEAITSGVGQTTRFAFDANGELASQSDGLGQTTAQLRDALRRITSTVLPDSAVATTGWDTLNQPARFTDPKAATTGFVYDAWGDVAQESSPDRGSVTHQRDAAGNLVARTDARGQTTRVQRDVLGRPTRISLPGGGTQEFVYDEAGRITLLKDASSSTAMQYDALGRLLQKRQSRLSFGFAIGNHTVAYQYHPGGGLAAVTYPSGLRVQYLRDAAGLITGVDVVLPGSGQTARPFVRDLAYTPLGQPRAWSWASGDSARREFDAAARITSTGFASYTYDAADRITGIEQRLWSLPAVSTPGSASAPWAVPLRWAVTYDRRDRIVGFEREGHRAGFVYDANSNRVGATELLDASGDLDAPLAATDTTQALQQTVLVDPASNRMTGFGQVLSTTTNGLQTSATSSVSYSHDAAGNLLSNGVRRFEYDGMNRLAKTIAATPRGPAQTRYVHNALGQRVFKSEPLYTAPASASTATTNGFVNWVRRVFTTIAGQVVTTWFYANNPSNTVELGNTFVYADGDLGEHNLLGEYGSGGAVLAGANEFIWLPVEGGLAIPVGLARGGRLYAIHADHLNTPRLITDDSNRPVWQWPYSAFGDNKPTGVLKSIQDPRPGATGSTPLLRSTAPAIEFNLRYPGQYFDQESGLHYNYFRSYQPSTGRYTQPDPIGLAGGMNVYGYVGGNPLRFVDPMGLAMVCLREGAGPFGHVGVSLGNNTITSGFYPRSGARGNLITGTPGIVQRDLKPIKECKAIDTTSDQDRLMAEYMRMARQSTPSDYALLTNNCTNFVSEVLRQGGIAVPPTSPRPRLFFDSLPGAPIGP